MDGPMRDESAQLSALVTGTNRQADLAKVIAGYISPIATARS